MATCTKISGALEDFGGWGWNFHIKCTGAIGIEARATAWLVIHSSFCCKIWALPHNAPTLWTQLLELRGQQVKLYFLWWSTLKPIGHEFPQVAICPALYEIFSFLSATYWCSWINQFYIYSLAINGIIKSFHVHEKEVGRGEDESHYAK